VFQLLESAQVARLGFAVFADCFALEGELLGELLVTFARNRSKQAWKSSLRLRSSVLIW
jgi:hypothetical protein